MAAITTDSSAPKNVQARNGAPATGPGTAKDRPRRRGTRMWDLLALPGAIWMSVFFIASLALVAALSFGTTSDLGDTYFGHTLVNIEALADPAYRIVLVRSLEYAVLTSVICLVIAYPVAYFTARFAGKRKGIILTMLIAPFWIS